MGLNNGVVQMKRLLIGVSAFLVTMGLSAPAAWATVTVLSANLIGANEVPPVSTVTGSDPRATIKKLSP